jgi:hypothetical protein
MITYLHPSAVPLHILFWCSAGVESPLVCDILPHADQHTGLMPHGVLDRLGEYSKFFQGSKKILLKYFRIAEFF